MTTLNELAYSVYSAETGQTGTLNEVTYAWLQQTTGLSGITLMEQWLEFLEIQGFSTGSLNERQMEFWAACGHDGKWNERYYKWLLGGGCGVNVLDSDGNGFCVSGDVLNSGGSTFTVTGTVLNSGGTPFDTDTCYTPGTPPTSVFQTYEWWFLYDNTGGTDTIRYYAVDLEAGTITQVGSLASPSGGNKPFATDGKYIFVGDNTNTNLRQYSWNGTTFDLVLNGAHAGINPCKYLHLPANNVGAGGSVFMYTTTIEASPGDASGVSYELTAPFSFGSSSYYPGDWEGTMDFRIDEGFSPPYVSQIGTNLLGKGLLLIGDDAGDTMESGTVDRNANFWPGGEFDGYQGKPGTFLTQTPNGAPSWAGWDRDSGVFCISDTATTMYLYQYDIATYLISEIGNDSSYAGGAVTITCAIVSDIIVTAETGGGLGATTWLRTYTRSGANLTLADSFQINGSGADSSNSTMFVSPYTNTLYYVPSAGGSNTTASAFTIDNNGMITQAATTTAVVGTWIGDNMGWSSSALSVT